MSEVKYITTLVSDEKPEHFEEGEYFVCSMLSDETFDNRDGLEKTLLIHAITIDRHYKNN